MDIKEETAILALQCIQNEMMEYKEDSTCLFGMQEILSDQEKDTLLEEIQRSCGISPLDWKRIYENSKEENEKVSASDKCLQMVHQRYTRAKSGIHPFETDMSETQLKAWCEKEKVATYSIMRNQLRKVKNFHATLDISVLEANQESEFSENVELYVIIQIGNELRNTTKATTNQKKQITWETENEFNFEVNSYENLELEISLWQKNQEKSDDLLGHTTTFIENHKWENGKETKVDIAMGNSEMTIVTLNVCFRFPQNKYFLCTVEERNECKREPKYFLCYTYLLQRLMGIPSPSSCDISSESDMNRVSSLNSLRSSGNHDKDQKNILSTSALWILSQFKLRFGIDTIHHYLFFLKGVESLFEPTENHISHTYTALQFMKSHLEDCTPSQLDQWNQTKSKLESKIKYFLPKFYLLFSENKSRGLINEFLEILLILSPSISNHLLDDLIRDASEEQLKNMILQVHNENREDFSDLSISDLQEEYEWKACHFCEIVEGITTYIEDVKENFDKPFEKLFVSVHSTNSNSTSLFSHMLLLKIKGYLYEWIKNFCENESSLQDPKAFDLYFSMKAFLEWSKNLFEKEYEEITLSLSSIFYGFIVDFLNDTLKNTPQMVDRICERDVDMEPIAENLLHSRSVVEIFASLSQNYHFICNLEMGEATFLGQYAEIACNTVQLYIDHLKKKFSQGNNHEFQVNMKFCITLNNIEQCTIQLQELLKRIEKDFRDFGIRKQSNIYEEIKLECISDTLHGCFKECFESIESSSKELLSIIYQGMDKNINRILSDAILTETPSHEPLEQLYSFLDDQIEILSFNLYSDLFKKVMRKGWNSVVTTLKTMLLPEDPIHNALNYEQISKIRTFLDDLRTYFCTDGQEIPIQFIDNKALIVTSMLQLTDQTTRQLIDLYQQKDSCDPYLTQENIKKIITMRASHKDNDAVLFIAYLSDNVGEEETTASKCFIS